MCKMLIGRKHSYGRSETLQKFVSAAILYWLLTSSQIDARKRLIPTNTNLSEAASLKSRRSPLYESRNNLLPFQLVNEHSQSVHPTQGHHLDHSDESPGQSDPQKYTYILKKRPRVQFRNPPQLYKIEGAKGSPRPTFLVRPRPLLGQSNSSPAAVYYPSPNQHDEHHLPNSGGNKYAFAYAVRPTDGYSSPGDDFSLSHKESRDGKVTTGEYKVLLPDGRLQIVRYTADGKSGFKADVTYEDKGFDHSHEHHDEHTKLLSKPSSEIQKQYFNPPSTSSPSFKTNPIYSPKQLKSHPSLAPSLVYNHAGSDDYHLHRQYVSPTPISLNSIAPTPDLGYKVSPSSYPFKRQGPTSTYGPYKRLSDSFQTSFQNIPPSTPKSIYDKINIQTSHYAPVSRGQRAGPATTVHTELPSYRVPSSPTLTHYEEDTHKNLHFYKTLSNPSGPPQHSNSQYIPSPTPFYNRRSQYNPSVTPFSKSLSPVAHAPDQSDYAPPPLYAHPSPTSFLELHKQNQISKQIFYASSLPLQPVNRSRLVPFELFKAGPSDSPANGHGGLQLNDHHDLHGHSNEHTHVEEHDSHFLLEEEHHDHSDPGHPSPIHHVETQLSQIPKSNLPLGKSSLATFTTNLAYRDGGSPKPTLYIKSKSQIPVGRPVRPSVGGLVYLDTPDAGSRSTALGPKGQLASLQHSNIPRPKTTTHPYELGSKDYGNNVSYNPTSETGDYKTIKETFIPSQRISPEVHLHHNSRDYLYEEDKERVIDYNKENLH